MITFPVSEAKQARLRERMAELGISESDLVEQFVRGSGAGGQKINKTSSTVTLHHPPTGVSVRCQESRQQALNRYLARVMLCDRIETLQRGRESAEAGRIAKLRRQKRRRSRRAKEKMLEHKAHHGKLKANRRFRGEDS